MVSLAATLPQQVRAVYPWTGAYLDVDGGRMHYLDEGPRDAPVMLCVHGNPTWSFYWRAIVAHFSQRYRVIVPDHVGCGLSDKPQSWDYRLAQHVENLQRLVDHLSLEDITLVVHDWGGAIGMGVATRAPERFKRFVVTNTAAFLSDTIPASIAVVKVPGFGALAVRGGNAFARAATFRAVSLPLAPAAKAGLLFPYGSWADRIATLRFVQDIPMAEKHPSYATLSAIDAGLAKLKDHPMLLCWGDDDFCFTPAFRAEWERRFPAAQSLHWTGVGHYVMEDAPDKVLAAMDTFLDPENAS
jgi:pimeloyl-ACP methyl ester carboxylesterase